MEVVPMSEEGTTATQETANQAGGSEQQQATGKTYSVEEMERIIAQRVNKAKSQFADYDDLKSKAARADELEQAQQTDMDKLRSKIEREAQRRAEAEEKANRATDRANTALMRAAVVSEAAQANAADPHDVFALLDKTALTVADDGTVDGVQHAVADLLKAKPHLIRRTAGGFNGGQQGGTAAPGPSMNDRIRIAAGLGPAQ